MTRFNIPIREAHKPHGRPAQPRFGQHYKSKNAMPIKFEVEQRAIDVVLGLKEEGLSLRRMAKILDQMKIPTKLNGKKWHPEMVKRILNGPYAASKEFVKELQSL